MRNVYCTGISRDFKGGPSGLSPGRESLAIIDRKLTKDHGGVTENVTQFGPFYPQDQAQEPGRMRDEYPTNTSK